MPGSFQYGEEIVDVVDSTPIIVVQLVDDLNVINTVNITNRDFTVTVTDTIINAALVPVDFTVALDDIPKIVTVFNTAYSPTEYEQTLLMLYAQYGFATTAAQVFVSLSALVNTELPEASAGEIV